MDFGKAAYTKVLELERKFGANDSCESHAGSIFESGSIQDLEIEAGKVMIDLGTLKRDQNANVCVIVKGELESSDNADIKISLLVNDDVIETKSVQVLSNESKEFDVTKVIGGLESELVLTLLIESNYGAILKSASMVVFNASREGSVGENMELRAVKTPESTYIISYIKNGSLFATEANPRNNLNLEFGCVMDEVVSHAFVFDKDNNLYLLYVDAEKRLFLRRVSSSSNDELISTGIKAVAACTAPQNSCASAVVAMIGDDAEKLFYFSIFDCNVGEIKELEVPNREYIELSLVSTSSFVYLVITSSSYENYILKSAYEPLGAFKFETLQGTYSFKCKKYNTLVDSGEEMAESVIGALSITAGYFENFSKMIESLAVSHLAGEYGVSADIYDVADAGSIHYSITIDKYNSDPSLRCEYGDDAVGLTPIVVEYNDATSTYDLLKINGWDKIWPFNVIRPCVLEEGQFKGYVDKNDFSKYEDGTSVGSDAGDSYVDVMIEVPKIYYKIETIGTQIFVHVASTKVDESYVCNAHVYDGVEQDKIYVAVYNSSIRAKNGINSLYSVSGQKINTTDIKYSTYEGLLETKPKGYRILNFDQVILIECLMILALKTTDPTVSFARGAIMTPSPKLTGDGDTLGMFAGNTHKPITMKFMGLENIYGNVHERVEGIYISKSPYAVYKRDVYSSVPVSKTGENYTLIVTNASLDGVSKTNQYLVNPYGTSELGFLPMSVDLDGASGSGTTYFADVVDFADFNGILYGGDCMSSIKSGPFCLKADTGSSGRIGYRLVYYPNKGD